MREGGQRVPLVRASTDNLATDFTSDWVLLATEWAAQLGTLDATCSTRAPSAQGTRDVAHNFDCDRIDRTLGTVRVGYVGHTQTRRIDAILLRDEDNASLLQRSRAA